DSLPPTANARRSPGVGDPKRSKPLVGASALRHDRRALEVADEARILAEAEDRNAMKQIAANRLIEQQTELPVLQPAVGIEDSELVAGRQPVRRSDRIIIVGELVADELHACACARVSRSGKRR